MARPSIKDERREQILEAFETCAARYGLEGATLERIAEEAGLARALIRHNVGNKEDLTDALVERFLTRSKAVNKAMLTALPEAQRALALIDMLFDPAHVDTQFMLLCEALIAAAADNPELAKKMRQWTVDFVGVVEDAIKGDFPKAKKSQVTAVAAGVTGIYFNVTSLTPLGSMPKLEKSSREAALLLIASLDD